MQNVENHTERFKRPNVSELLASVGKKENHKTSAGGVTQSNCKVYLSVN